MMNDDDGDDDDGDDEHVGQEPIDIDVFAEPNTCGILLVLELQTKCHHHHFHFFLAKGCDSRTGNFTSA